MVRAALALACSNGSCKGDDGGSPREADEGCEALDDGDLCNTGIAKSSIHDDDYRCNDWTATNAESAIGSTDSMWTFWKQYETCLGKRRIHCFEQSFLGVVQWWR